jgi:hypothetical protein
MPLLSLRQLSSMSSAIPLPMLSCSQPHHLLLDALPQS